MYKLLLSLFILLFLILACSDSNKNKTTIDDKSVKKNEMINGNVGKYTYSYVRKGAKIAVAFDGKGVDIENKKTSYEDAAILLTLMQTINSVSGFEDININDLKDYKIKGESVRLKGKNCYYDVFYVIEGNYLTTIAYNECN